MLEIIWPRETFLRNQSQKTRKPPLVINMKTLRQGKCLHIQGRVFIKKMELLCDTKGKQLLRNSMKILIGILLSAMLFSAADVRAQENKVPQVGRPLSLREKLNSLTYTPAVKELARDRRRASLAGMFLGQKNGAVGYHPIISILPQGNMMVAGPVILSPDRRYARIGISYSNTSIGAVHTFNFSTGRYQAIEGK